MTEPEPENKLLQQVISLKASYRKFVQTQNLTWEEKITAVQRMQIADRLAKEGMCKTMAAMRKSSP